MDVSVIVVNYNTKDLTIDCLSSIYEKTFGINFEVFVIDNASQDNSCEEISRLFPQVKIISNKENLGFGRANNLGIKEAQGKYVFLLNTDTVLINNAIKILFDLIENDDSIGVCGANLFDKNLNPVHSYGFLNSPKRHLLRFLGLRYFCKNIKNDARRDELQEVEQVTGAALMIRKSVFDKVGLFNERFFLYCEESELQFRIRNAGFKIFYTPEAKIFHYEGSSTKKDKKFRRQLITQSEYLYFTLCYERTPKIFLKILCTIPQLYRLLSAPGNTIRALKYIWSN